MMNDFLTKNQLLIGVVVGSFIIGLFIYAGNKPVANNISPQQMTQETTEQTPEKQNDDVKTEEITEQPKQVKVSQPKPTAIWHYVTSFEGVGIKDTAPFQISGSKWRIKWSCETINGTFGLSVHGKSVNGGDPGAEIVRTQCPFSGTNVYSAWPGYEPPGGFFLGIIADKVNAQEYTS